MGKCENLHGHNWRVRLTVRGDTLDRIGLLVDFGDLKRILEEAVGRYDHANLNDVPPFDGDLNPTSEHLARELAVAIGEALPENVQVESVTVWESDRCSAMYKP